MWPRQGVAQVGCGLNSVWGLVRGEVEAEECPEPGMGPSQLGSLGMSET